MNGRDDSVYLSIIGTGLLEMNADSWLTSTLWLAGVGYLWWVSGGE